jgi:AhpD family alkylhydroperoxidase
MFRTMAHRPEIFETIISRMEAVLNTGTLPKALKEPAVVRTSQLNRAPYCLASPYNDRTQAGVDGGADEALHHAGDNKEFRDGRR